MVMESDKDCISVGLKTCNEIDHENPRIIRIKDTLHLEEIYISEAMIPEARANKQMEIIGEPQPFPFDEKGNLW